MTDQPTTPTVDTDELRGLLREAQEFVDAACADDLSRRIDRALNATSGVVCPEHGDLCRGPDCCCADLHRPAPAEPGATEVEQWTYNVEHFAGEEPSGRYEHWTWELIDPSGRVYLDGTDTENPTPKLVAIAGGEISWLAALAASPAPADEGREVDYGKGACGICGGDVAWDRRGDLVHRQPNQQPTDHAPTLSGDARTALAAARTAAPPAPAVPEERDEGGWLAELLAEHGWHREATGTAGSMYARGDEVVGVPHGLSATSWEWPDVFARITAARPAPVTAAPTEEEAP